MTQRLRYNVTGQVLRHVPGARQATADWVLEDLFSSADGSSRTLDSGTGVAVDAATESLTAAAGPATADPTLLTVASTTGFSVRTDRDGRPVSRYEIVDAAGRGERFTLAGVTTNASLHTLEPLTRSYAATGCTIRGVELTTSSILASVLQDEQLMLQDRPMRVVWTYANGFRAQEQVRLIRDDAIDISQDAVVADIREQFPDVATRMLYQGRDTLPGHVRSWIRNLRAMALGRKIQLEQWLTGEQGHWAVVWRVLWHLAMLGNRPAPATGNEREWADYCKSEFEARWLALTIGDGHSESMKLEPTEATAATSHDTEYRAVITGL